MWPVIVATLLTIGATARLTRLVTVDEWPPIVHAKAALTRRYGIDHWIIKLVNCPWCAAPWIVIPIGATALPWHHHPAWWIPAAWLTFSYLAAAIVARDA